jgi:menaquinol-cytochrome c reductase iron-sulfur subunit
MSCCCQKTPESSPEGRRGFIAQTAAILFGGLALIGPAAAALLTFLNPLREKSAGGKLVRLTDLAMLPEGGEPRKFPVIADRSDAWNRFPNEPIGAVFLRRTGPRQVEAFNVICPHAGCFVTYEAKDNIYFCPCHTGRFELSGKRKDTTSPSPRDLDSLAVEIRGNEVWVKFENFQTNTPQKKPLA